MLITKENVGDILLFHGTGLRFKVDEVRPDKICYSAEDGSRYASKALSVDAEKLLDKNLIQSFEENMALGRCLAAAETSALQKILNGELSPQDKDDAVLVLGSTRKQRRHLEERIASQTAVLKKTRLNDIISAAEKRTGDAQKRSDQEKGPVR